MDATKNTNFFKQSSITYIFLAEKKFQMMNQLYVIACDMNWYNDLAVNCQQLAEYSLKAAFERQLTVEVNNQDLKLLDGHKLVPLARKLNKLHGNIFNTDDCSILQEYYFNARYPGEDFINVTRYDAEHAMQASIHIYQTVLELMR